MVRDEVPGCTLGEGFGGTVGCRGVGGSEGFFVFDLGRWRVSLGTLLIAVLKAGYIPDSNQLRCMYDLASCLCVDHS